MGKTAVEQFAIALYEKGFLKGNGDDIQELLEQFKEMEKQQIIDAYDCGKEQASSSQLSPIEYYKETFGKDE
jgi:hypothetical protein